MAIDSALFSAQCSRRARVKKAARALGAECVAYNRIIGSVHLEDLYPAFQVSELWMTHLSCVRVCRVDRFVEVAREPKKNLTKNCHNVSYSKRWLKIN